MQQQRKYQSSTAKPCDRKFLCRNLKETKCSHHHTEQEKSYGQIYKFLHEVFITGQQQKFILGTVKKLENSEKFKLLPCNKEITQPYPELSFTVLEDPKAEDLSEEFYYEAEYEEKDDKNGAFSVKNVMYWGTIGEAEDDVEALFYGQEKIYEDFQRSTRNFKEGIFIQKRNGEKVVEYGYGKKKEYFILTEKDQNRAFSGSTVKFREVKNDCAQIVSIVENSFEDVDGFGILEASPDLNRNIEMEHLYCPVPQEMDWDLLEKIFHKTGKIFATSFENPILTRKEFEEKYAGILRVKQEDQSLLFLTDMIFSQKETTSIEIDQVKKRWNSLYNLMNHQKQMNQAKGNYYFKSFNKNLPIFQCLPLKGDLLNENPEIWRSYVRVRYIGWPVASKHPWVTVESDEGLISDHQADIRVILKRNYVTTDWFSKEVQEDEKELLRAYDEMIEESLETYDKVEEKVFTIDGEGTKYRDDGFSVKKLADGGSYEIGIHIADVTRIVNGDTEVYYEAQERFHSCYVGRNFYKPMLPYNLQKYLSLQKDQWRFAFSMFILMNKEGVIDLEKTRFKHVLIKPAANLTYEQVDQIISQANFGKKDEVKEATLLMNELGMKLSERRRRLGCKLEIDEEDHSPAHLMVEEFMILVNEIATDYVKHQGEALGKKLVKLRNEEKRLVREGAEKKEEERRKVKEEKEENLKDEPLEEHGEESLKEKTLEEEQEESVTEKTSEEGEENQQTPENEEEKEIEVSEKEEVSEYEEEVETKRRGSESEEKSQTESNRSSVNEREKEEEKAVSACEFLIRQWGDAINDKLDLSDKQVFLESKRRMKRSKTITNSLKQYFEYLLRVNNQKIDLVIKKKLPLKICPRSDFEIPEQQTQSPEPLKTFKKKNVFEEEEFPALGGESLIQSPADQTIKKEEVFEKEEFPALGEESHSRSADKTIKKEKAFKEEESPALGGESHPSSADKTIKKEKVFKDEFPAFGEEIPLSIAGKTIKKGKVLKEEFPTLREKSAPPSAGKTFKEEKLLKKEEFPALGQEYPLPSTSKTIKIPLKETRFISSTKRQIQSPVTSETFKKKNMFEEEEFPALGQEYPFPRADKPIKSSLKDTGLNFSIKLTKSKPKKKARQTSPDEICEEKRDLELLSLEPVEKISVKKEEMADVHSKEEPGSVGKNEEMVVATNASTEGSVKIEEEEEILETKSLDQLISQDKSEEVFKEEEQEEIESDKEEEGFSVKQSEKIMKRYDNLENSQKLKFTSPIRRFNDILVHELIDEILQIEEEIVYINETIQEKLTEQEQENEDDKNKKKKKKKRYQIFQDLNSQLKERISELETFQKDMRYYYEENSSNKKGDISRAEREIKNMEVCKSVIFEQESILADAIVVKILDGNPIEVFLAKYSIVCPLNCWKVNTKKGRAEISFPDQSAVEVRVYEDIKVEIHVKKTFPLEFDVSYHRRKL